MRLPPGGIRITADIDSRTIHAGGLPGERRPLRGLLAAALGLLTMALSFWLLLAEPLPALYDLSMLLGFLGSGALFWRALASFEPQAPTTHRLRLTATHLSLDNQPPVLLEAMTTISACGEGLRLQWGEDGTVLRLPPASAQWLADTLKQAVIRRTAAPHQAVPEALEALRDA